MKFVLGRIYLFTILVFGLNVASFSHAEELRILCWEGYAPPKFTRKFERYISDKYDIALKVTVRNVSSPQEFFDWVRIKDIDLISPAHNIPKSPKWQLIERKLVLPLNLNNIPNYQLINPALRNSHYVTSDDKVYGVPIVYGSYGLAYNTAYFSAPPKSWRILFDNKYKGRFVLSADYYEANVYIAALASGLGGEDIFDFDNLWYNDTVQENLRTLALNAKSFWIGTDKASDLHGLALAIAWGFSFNELKSKGEVWKFAQPQEGTTGWVDNWLVSHSLKDNPMMKQIAEEWINFSIGSAMQIHYARELGQFPVNFAIRGELTKEEVERFKLDDADYINNQLILWETLSLREQNGLLKMWENARNNKN